MKPHTKTLGDRGESIIADKMQQAGFTLLARNYRTPFGEIDIIAQQGDTIAFVEVKTRQHMFFDISQVITPAKQKKIIMVAKTFLAHYSNPEVICRFDVAILEHHNNSSAVTYIPNAFYGHE